MSEDPKTLNRLIDTLEERVKELNCLYELEELLHHTDKDFDELFSRLISIIPPALQYPEICNVKLVYGDHVYKSPEYKESPWALNTNITVQDRVVGSIRVSYSQEKPEADVGPFLLEEKRLLDTIAQRLGHYIMYQKLKSVFNKWETTKQDMSSRNEGEWRVILELLKRTDPDTYIRITRKMLNHLVWRGIEETDQLLQQFNPFAAREEEKALGETNTPLARRRFGDMFALSKKVFQIAAHHMNNREILTRIQQWMQQDKTSFLIKAVSNNDSSLTDINEAIRRYYQINPDGMALAPSARIGVRAALIRRFFSDQLEFINIAKNYVHVRDFHDILHRMIFPTGSHGKLGGKSAGMFLAFRVLRKANEFKNVLRDIKTPKTWYITSDSMIHFMHYNNLEEILEQKYKPIEEVKKEYPHIIQLFKNSHFPGELKQGLSVALDDFGTRPLVVRSSSLLEDRLGSAFSGKYKSLFIANQGSKEERLNALMDAIAEVYASTIGPDPIQYRAERGLLDFHEEMGVMIQQVVGQQVGDYFMPAFAGVAFSNNEFRWSPRIKREDGLVRLVPGLGTRAVDRLSDDYPTLVAPGQPNLRANVSLDERVRYSPQKMDVINLKTNKFETIDISELLREHGNEYPVIDKLASVFEHDHLRKPTAFNTNFQEADTVITFEGLISDTAFVKEIHTILKVLQSAMATPVDIEFAHDGKNFYLLQCRPQSYSQYHAPAIIPDNLPQERIIFSARRYISNGTVNNIKYIVYVEPDKYSEVEDLEDLKAIGQVVSELNKLLPKRRFILMGPGRWGSRGDIKLGVSVTYSDINNAAVLIEIAKKKGNYLPDLSFGTHFFQDLVESSIFYLPLYPDDEGVIFRESFFKEAPNMLFELVPAYSYLSDVVHVIEVSQAANGFLLSLLMNADQEFAAGILAPPSTALASPQEVHRNLTVGAQPEDHTVWRTYMAEKLASQIDPERFGVKACYLLGSAKNKTAQPGSDIDLLVHFKGDQDQRRDLENWLNGWSLCLDEMNFLRTGIKAGGILDVQIVGDREINDQQLLVERFNLSEINLEELPLGRVGED